MTDKKPRRFTEYELKRMSDSKYLRYDKESALWTQHRRNVYLYWFKFLQHAENDEDFSVDWSKYKDWGGREVVMNSKFDDWWKEYWKDCFGFPEKQPEKAKFFTKKRPKVEALRAYLFTYEQREKSNWDIAVYIYLYEDNRLQKKTKVLGQNRIDMYREKWLSLLDRYEEHDEFGSFEPDLQTEPTPEEKKQGISRWTENPRKREKTLVSLVDYKDGIQTPKYSEGWKTMEVGDADYWAWELAMTELTQKRKLKEFHQKQVSKYRKEYKNLMNNICNGSIDNQ